ncbi:hypothetical protein [Sphingomonas sp. 3-13AW]|uniref:hypothetical protein n=1 Tax=Sphingomonas sp. 3-13AW TaxID=3050450 RepID=UPI003BB5A86B
MAYCYQGEYRHACKYGDDACQEAADGDGCYVEAPEWKDDQWLVDESAALYAIPLDGDAVEGPDDDVCDTILGILHHAHADVLDENEILLMGTSEVPAPLRRFSPEIGYYSA